MWHIGQGNRIVALSEYFSKKQKNKSRESIPVMICLGDWYPSIFSLCRVPGDKWILVVIRGSILHQSDSLCRCRRHGWRVLALRPPVPPEGNHYIHDLSHCKFNAEQCVLAGRSEVTSRIPWTKPRNELTWNCIHSSLSSVCLPDAQRQNPESHEPIPVMNWPETVYTFQCRVHQK